MGKSKNIAIIGGGPSGLMAAEILASAGHIVTIYDKMPSLGRKFLMAGRGGLNITHIEPLEYFIKRYGAAAGWIAPYIKAFSPQDLRSWCEGLGQETFVGSSGRVFPKVMKAAPLLRAWLGRLQNLGVKYYPQHSWQGWHGNALEFVNSNQQIITVTPDATFLAMGGASWPRLGANGSWVEILQKAGVDVAPLEPSNCGFMVQWSDFFANKFAGTPLKSVAVSCNNISHQAEVMLTKNGIEGGAIYAISPVLRNAITTNGTAQLYIDLRPSMSVADLARKLQTGRGSESFSNYLRKAGFAPVVASLLREVSKADASKLQPEALAELLKSLPITLTATAGMARAISSAGGIKLAELDENLMIKKLPNVYACGEMLDWEAPTGGYLLQGCFATAVAAARGFLSN